MEFHYFRWNNSIGQARNQRYNSSGCLQFMIAMGCANSISLRATFRWVTWDEKLNKFSKWQCYESERTVVVFDLESIKKHGSQSYFTWLGRWSVLGFNWKYTAWGANIDLFRISTMSYIFILGMIRFDRIKIELIIRKRKITFGVKLVLNGGCTSYDHWTKCVGWRRSW